MAMILSKAGNFRNMCVVIQYSQDQAWYRGVVHMLDEQGVAQVLLVDYGNIEEVPVSSHMFFLKISIFAQ